MCSAGNWKISSKKTYPLGAVFEIMATWAEWETVVFPGVVENGGGRMIVCSSGESRLSINLT
jgi:hypothetical protein